MLVLSVSTEEADVTDAIMAGAAGHVLKEQPVEEVVAGFQAAAHGEPHISSGVAMQLMRRLREHEAEGTSILTKLLRTPPFRRLNERPVKQSVVARPRFVEGAP